MTDIGKLIKLARKGRGWTQAMLAEAIQVSQVTVCRIESGEQSPSIEQLLAISWALTRSEE